VVEAELDSVFVGWQDANDLKIVAVFDPRTARGYGA
jgi:hypothetical protein